MSYSTQRAVSNGTMVYLDLSISYQSRKDIKVFFNDLPAPAGSWAWVGTTDKRISFTAAVPNGVEVLVQRTTRIDRIINVFAQGAKFNNSTMDDNFQQVLYLTQEAVEGSALSDIYNDVDFHGYKIKNLGQATADNEAVTFGQVKSMGTGAYQAQLAAEAARNLAQAWATQLGTPVQNVDWSAKAYAQNAGVESGKSAASATASAQSAAASQVSRLASEVARDRSEAARDRSEAARDRAEGAAAPATEVFTRLTAVEGVASQANTTANTANTAAQNANTQVGNKVSKAGDTMTGDLYIRANGSYSPWLHFYADGTLGTHIRVGPGGMEWYDSAIAARNMVLDNAGNLSVPRGFVSAGGRVQGGDLLSQGIVYSGGGASQLAPDGNVYGGVWGGYLSNWLNAQLAGKVNSRRNDWANQGFVVTNSANNVQIWWDGRVQVQIDNSYQGYMWTSGNFDPGSKANRSAQCQIAAYADFGGIDARNENTRANVPAPYVMTGLIQNGRGRGPSADCFGSLNLHGAWLVNQ